MSRLCFEQLSARQWWRGKNPPGSLSGCVTAVTTEMLTVAVGGGEGARLPFRHANVSLAMKLLGS